MLSHFAFLSARNSSRRIFRAALLAQFFAGRVVSSVVVDLCVRLFALFAPRCERGRFGVARLRQTALAMFLDRIGDDHPLKFLRCVADTVERDGLDQT